MAPAARAGPPSDSTSTRTRGPSRALFPASVQSAAGRAVDVRAPAAVTLLEAMRTAEDRDRIAWTYVHGFADVFEIGVPTFRRAMERSNDW